MDTVEIPDAAVEAASAYMEWVFDHVGSPADMRAAMKHALEVAAPLLLAEANRTIDFYETRDAARHRLEADPGCPCKVCEPALYSGAK